MSNEYEGGDVSLSEDWDVAEGTPEGNDEVIDVREETASVNDRVTDLILGGSGDLGEGETPTKGRNFTTRDLDAHGRIDHGDTQQQQEAPTQQPTQNQTIYAQQVSAEMDQVSKAYNEAVENNERADEMLRNGEITPEQHHQITFELGQQAGAARDRAYQLRIMQLEHGIQRDAQFKELERTGGEDWSPENRDATMQGIINFATQNGIDMETLSGVENSSEAMFLYRAWKDSEAAEAQRLEIAHLKQRNRELTRQIKGKQRTAQKSSQLGTRSGTDTQINQVMDVLADAGAFGGGKKR